MRKPDNNSISMAVILAITVAATTTAHSPAAQRLAAGQNRPPSITMHRSVLQVQKFVSGEPALTRRVATSAWVWDAAIRQFSLTCTIYAVTRPGFDGTKVTSVSLTLRNDRPFE